MIKSIALWMIMTAISAIIITVYTIKLSGLMQSQHKTICLMEKEILK